MSVEIAIKVLNELYAKKLAEAEGILEAVRILKKKERKSGGTLTTLPPADKKTAHPSTKGKRGYVHKSCISCGKIQYVHARTAACPECGAVGMVKTDASQL